MFSGFRALGVLRIFGVLRFRVYGFLGLRLRVLGFYGFGFLRV